MPSGSCKVTAQFQIWLPSSPRMVSLLTTARLVVQSFLKSHKVAGSRMQKAEHFLHNLVIMRTAYTTMKILHARALAEP